MADRYILAVESSCDETSVAVLKNEKELLSNIIASQVESHKRFGGVVPEVASRHHVEVVTLCIKDALSEAGITAEQLDAVAVTYGPGLVGALLVGMAAAKAFAWAHGLPLIPVNHMAGHLMAAREVQELEYPLLALWCLEGTQSWFMCQNREITRLLVRHVMMQLVRPMTRSGV